MRPHQRFVSGFTVMSPLGEGKRFWVAWLLEESIQCPSALCVVAGLLGREVRGKGAVLLTDVAVRGLVSSEICARHFSFQINLLKSTIINRKSSSSLPLLKPNPPTLSDG